MALDSYSSDDSATGDNQTQCCLNNPWKFEDSINHQSVVYPKSEIIDYAVGESSLSKYQSILLLYNLYVNHAIVTDGLFSLYNFCITEDGRYE